MTRDPAVACRDACPECGARDRLPWSIEPAGEASLRCRYRCDCGHCWRRSWTEKGTQGASRV